MGAKKGLVYTVITGDYDTLHEPNKSKGFDYICFTDNPNIRKNGWDLHIIPKESNPIKHQRQIKINSHKLPYDLTVYFDSNFHMYRPIDTLLNNCCYKKGFLTCLHDTRTLLSEEAMRIVKIQKDTIQVVGKHMMDLAEKNIPDNCGMYASGFIVRRKSEEVTRLEKVWSDLLDKGSHRDQLSLGPAAFISGTKIQTITRMELRHYARLLTHKRQ